jgi:hypothetical protein
MVPQGYAYCLRFNPPKGILFIVTGGKKPCGRSHGFPVKNEFQSPEGDSLHCHLRDGIATGPAMDKVSIPRRGFSSLSPDSRSGTLRPEIVSIPRRGFSSLSQVGYGVIPFGARGKRVSIPRRGFSSLSLVGLFEGLTEKGFQSPEGDSLHCHLRRMVPGESRPVWWGFNPPKGILFIVTKPEPRPLGQCGGGDRFQSPEGDSLHCHRRGHHRSKIIKKGGDFVSIPRRGFSSLSRGDNPNLTTPSHGFQSPEGDSLHCH